MTTFSKTYFMAKILISWTATVHDFVKPSGEVNTTGPNCSVHEHFYQDYDKHVLLTAGRDIKDDTAFQRLVLYLRKTYRRTIEDVAMEIDKEELIDPSAISKVVNKLLLTRYKRDEIHIFISPGTPAMQVAWYLAQVSIGGHNIKLFQTHKDRSGNHKQTWVTQGQLS